MDIVSVGRWLFLILGVLVFPFAAWFTVKNPKATKVITTIWSTAVIMMGVGAFGPEFLPKYRAVLETITDMAENPSEQSYATFFNSVGSGKIPAGLQKVGTNYAISHPIKDMDTIINTAIEKAPDSTDGRKVLVWAKDSYQGKQREIDNLMTTKASIDTTRTFDLTTRKLIYDKMIRLPDEQKTKLGIDSTFITEYEKAVKPFPKLESGTLRTRPISLSAPDLIIESLTHTPANPTTTDSITFKAVVKNIGAGTAGPSTLALKVGRETVPKTYPIPELKRGQTYTVQRRMSLSKPQRYMYKATADVKNNVHESNETNNERTNIFTVRNP